MDASIWTRCQSDQLYHTDDVFRPWPFGATTISITNPDLAGIANQQSNVWFRLAALSASTGSGNRDTFGIDDVTLSWTNSPQYWDTNGAASGIGGTATWSSTAANWSSEINGEITPGIYNPYSPTIFGGTAGTATIASGGISANGGITFNTDGYIVSDANNSSRVLTLATNNTITVTTASHVATMNVKIAGGDGLTKAGDGILVLSRANTYSGGTSIDAGLLRVANTTGSATGGGDVNINSGGTLGGGGIVSGSVSVNSGGTIAPGNSIGNLTTGAETWAGGGAYEWEVGSVPPGSMGAGTDWDHIQMGALTVSADTTTKFKIKVVGNPTGFNQAPPLMTTGGFYAWVIATTAGITGFDPAKFDIDLSAFTPTISNNGYFFVGRSGNDLLLYYVPGTDEF